MSLLDIVKVLEQYKGAETSAPPQNAEQDFQQVAQSAQQPHLASGLAEAFRSNQTPPFPQMLASLFGQSNGQQRAGILNELLGSLGGGSAAQLVERLLGGQAASGQVTPQQAEQVSPEAVQQLAQHAQANDPSIVERASSFYAQHPKVVQALGAGALALVMSHMSRSA
jgi:hypothetical protein